MGKIPEDCLVCLRIAWESYGVCECPCWPCVDEDKIAKVMRERGLGFPEAVEWLGKAIVANGAIVRATGNVVTGTEETTNGVPTYPSGSQEGRSEGDGSSPCVRE